jgi:hypothetical protein
MNAQYMYDAMMGNKIQSFDLIEFKEGQRPKLEEIEAAAKNIKADAPKKDIDEPFLGKKAAEAPVPKNNMLDDDEKKPEIVDEEAKKKARAEMRKKLMLPDDVTSKLKGINTGGTLEKKKTPEIPKLMLMGKKEELGFKSGNDMSIRDVKPSPNKEEEKK